MRLHGQPDGAVEDLGEDAYILTLAEQLAMVLLKRLAEIQPRALDFGDTLVLVGAALVESVDA